MLAGVELALAVIVLVKPKLEGFFQPRQLLHNDSGSELQLQRESSSKRSESSKLKRSISSGFHSAAPAPAAAPCSPAPPATLAAAAAAAATAPLRRDPSAALPPPLPPAAPAAALLPPPPLPPPFPLLPLRFARMLVFYTPSDSILCTLFLENIFSKIVLAAYVINKHFF